MRLAKSEDVNMRKFDHPNLVKCHDVYENKDLKIITMEYCSGNTLYAYVKERVTLHEAEALSITKQILNGIGVPFSTLSNCTRRALSTGI